jgi:hypothetical protein
MKYDIYISDMDRKTVLQLPIIPEEMPSFSKSSSNEEFESFSDGKYNLIGDVGLLEFTLESFLPGKGKNYPFQRVKNINPDLYIQLINAAMINKKPLRVVIVRGGDSFNINSTFSVETFEWHDNKVGDYQYSISFKEWRDYNV